MSSRLHRAHTWSHFDRILLSQCISAFSNFIGAPYITFSLLFNFCSCFFEPESLNSMCLISSQGGYLLGAATTYQYSFDPIPGDVFFCTADCGWITGHSYVAYGPLLNGATQVIWAYTFGCSKLWRRRCF